MVEKWKPIEGYEGLYEVSNLGTIKNLKKNSIKMPYITKQGYFRIELWKNNKGKKYFVHRLVAEAFLPKIEGKTQVNHIDECKTNNNVKNLEWCTNLENHRHGTINERISKSLTNNKKKSKPVKALDDNGNCIGIFPSIYEASRMTGINVSCIRDCLHGRNRAKHAGGYVWQFTE